MRMPRPLASPPLVPLAVLFAIGLFSASPAPAQPVDAAATLKKARQAIAAKDYAGAHASADAVLAANSRARDAYAVKIEAHLAQTGTAPALKVYAAAVKALGEQDLALLGPIARAELVMQAGSKAASQSAVARGHLAKAGDKESRAALEKAAASKQDDAERMTAEDALVSLGDAAALKAVEARLASEAPAQRAAALSLLVEAAPPRARAALPRMLQEADMNVRLAATDAAATLGATETVATLKSVLASAEMPLVRLSAASSLLRLGDASARPLMLEALASPVEDARLLAADAFARAPKALSADWVPAVRGLLASEDVLTRIQAARQLASADRTAARGVLEAALLDINPAVRDAALTALLALSSPDVDLLWPRLADESPWVRLKAAGALLAAARQKA